MAQRARKEDKETRRQRQHELQRAQEIARKKHSRVARRKQFGLWIGGGIVAVAAITAAVLYALHGASSVDAHTVSSDLGKPTSDLPQSLSGFTKAGAVLRQGGKPELLFIGAQYCPHCAGQRWAVVKALDQFGTFSGLTSSANDDGTIPTFDVLAASYSSTYVSYDHKDVQDRNHNNLQSLSLGEQGVFNKLDPSGGIPLIAVGGYSLLGDGYNLNDVTSMSFASVQTALQRDDRKQQLVPDINAEANAITALICHSDGMQPASVCGVSVIRKIVASLH